MNKEENDEEQIMGYSTIPHVVIDSGLWARMKPSERSVYGVLCRYRNYKTELCFPNVKTICEKSGYSKGPVCNATKRLEIYGLIEKKRAPQCFKFKMIYRVFKNPKIDSMIIPWKSEKRKSISRKRDGKFAVVPSKSELDIVPSKPDLNIIPSGPEHKETEISLNEYSLKEDKYSFTISEKTIKELERVKGKEWVNKELRKCGYVVEQEP